MTATLRPGVYNVVVEGYSTAEGTYSLTADCNMSIPDVVQGSITCGSTVYGDTTYGSHFIGYTTPDAHYTFNLTDTMNVSFDACNASFDATLWLYNEDLSTYFAAMYQGGCGKYYYVLVTTVA